MDLNANGAGMFGSQDKIQTQHQWFAQNAKRHTGTGQGKWEMVNVKTKDEYKQQTEFLLRLSIVIMGIWITGWPIILNSIFPTPTDQSLDTNQYHMTTGQLDFCDWNFVLEPIYTLSIEQDIEGTIQGSINGYGTSYILGIGSSHISGSINGKTDTIHSYYFYRNESGILKLTHLDAEQTGVVEWPYQARLVHIEINDTRIPVDGYSSFGYDNENISEQIKEEYCKSGYSLTANFYLEDGTYWGQLEKGKNYLFVPTGTLIKEVKGVE